MKLKNTPLFLLVTACLLLMFAAVSRVVVMMEEASLSSGSLPVITKLSVFPNAGQKLASSSSVVLEELRRNGVTRVTVTENSGFFSPSLVHMDIRGKHYQTKVNLPSGFPRDATEILLEEAEPVVRLSSLPPTHLDAQTSFKGVQSLLFDISYKVEKTMKEVRYQQSGNF